MVGGMPQADPPPEGHHNDSDGSVAEIGGNHVGIPDHNEHTLGVPISDDMGMEDIVDSGLTLAYLRGVLGDRRPASLEICALLVREGAEDSGARYAGFPIPPDFVVGYGLDVAEHYRELDAIRVFEPE